ncbi:hypothetical protein FIM12_04370 [SAR202 cluster bacterium AD-804-J14_MRT_500m]|nr:hypothetical protein [SAR202 cluster bacterium AD-804-J14_MRT_500m]
MESKNRHPERGFWLRWALANIVGLAVFNGVAHGVALAVADPPDDFGPHAVAHPVATAALVLTAVIVLVWRIRQKGPSPGGCGPPS